MFSEEELNKKVLQYETVLVTNREIETLKGPHFLNDVIIDFYFLHISNTLLESHTSFRDDILLVLPAVSFFLQQNFGDDSHIKEFADNNQVASKQVIMFPVNNNRDGGTNDGGSHWSLLVYYRKPNTFVHYDSLGSNGWCARKLFRAVKKHVATPTAETTQPESTSTNDVAPSIVEGEIESNPIDVDCNNASTIGSGNVTKSSMTSTVDNVHADAATTTSQVPQVVEEDGDSTSVINSDDSSMFENDENERWPWVHGFHDPRRHHMFNENEDEEERQFQENMMFYNMHHHPYYSHPRFRPGPGYMGPYGPYGRRRFYSRWNMMNNEHHRPIEDRRPVRVEEDDGFREEGCMPKQSNFYDCGLYVMEIARVVCEWYYLDDVAKQQQPEHKGLFCKLKGGGQFPNIGEYVETSVECTMRRMLLETIQRRAFENGVTINVLSSRDHEVNNERAIVLFDEDGKSEKNEAMDEDDGAAALDLYLRFDTRNHKGGKTEDEREVYDSMQDDPCPLSSKEDDSLLAKKQV